MSQHWSKYFQNPLYMEMTRNVLLSDSMRPLIVQFCQIQTGDGILDVGCGTGSFTRYLRDSGLELKLAGIDRDAALIEFAGQIELSKERPDRIEYHCGDACELPFQESQFDAVVSHTFLTSVSDPEKAMSEMMRVVKDGGIIASVTTMSYTDQTWHRGHYPDGLVWLQELRDLENIIWKMYQSIDPISRYTAGKACSELPYFFAESGLGEVSLFPIGKAFSLSNAAIPNADKEHYIRSMYEAERQKLDNFMELPELLDHVSKEQCQRYLDLLLIRRNYLLENLGENRIWEWSGGANILVTGRAVKNKKGSAG